uniref:Uncharacterized protein n=1 Tax=Anguilla anguilla TaxID=7936 RepID=A0A0E9W1C2_ANGAN
MHCAFCCGIYPLLQPAQFSALCPSTEG